MTKAANSETITLTLPEATIVAKDKTITLKLEDATDLIRIALAARKDGYAARRANRVNKTTKTKEERIAKLQSQLAALTGASDPAPEVATA